MIGVLVDNEEGDKISLTRSDVRSREVELMRASFANSQLTNLKAMLVSFNIAM